MKYVTVDDLEDDKLEEALELVLCTRDTLRNRDQAQETLRVSIKDIQVVESSSDPLENEDDHPHHQPT